MSPSLSASLSSASLSVGVRLRSEKRKLRMPHAKYAQTISPFSLRLPRSDTQQGRSGATWREAEKVRIRFGAAGFNVRSYLLIYTSSQLPFRTYSPRK